MKESGNATVFQLLVNLRCDLIVIALRKEWELISKHSKGNFKHLIAHSDEDSSFMFATPFQAKVKGFQIIIMHAEVASREIYHVTKVVVSLLRNPTVGSLRTARLLDDRIRASFLNQLTSMREMRDIAHFKLRL